jgi:RNA polymerase sigma-70 factor, ECF subfamily
VSVDWAEVYRTTYRDVFRFLYRKIWDAERARELAQETFVRALDAAPANPRAWLFRVAANLARDEVRLVIRRKRHLALLKSEAALVTAAPPDAALERQRRAETVRQALESLAERDREVLLLWDAGLDYREIAEQTGLAPGSVGTTLARARRRLVAACSGAEATDAARG